MTTHPLTHHEILGLIEPFARGGRQVDLAASDRIERKLVFKPIDHADLTSELVDINETLKLESLRLNIFRLTRTLTLPCGLQATLLTEGASPGELLSRIESVPPQRQFRPVDDTMMALSYRINLTKDASAGNVTMLTRAEARLDGLSVILTASTVKGYPASIDLVPDHGSTLEFPEDLLAVQGWDWGPLKSGRGGWTSKMRMSGAEPRRSRQAEIKFEATIAHLARTLAATPRQFHETLVRQRWGVAFRRGIPLLLCVSLILAAAAVSMMPIPQDSIVNMLIMFTPAVLGLLPFCMHDTPPLELPPLPRLSPAPAWRRVPPPTNPQNY
jgi:hypothetical protein